MTHSPSTWIALRPHDTVHVRDGRAFVGGAGGRAETTRPSPSTIAGAIGAACRVAVGAPRLPASVRGPILVQSNRTGSRWSPFFSVPRDLMMSRTLRDTTLVRGRAQHTSGCITDLDDELEQRGLPSPRYLVPRVPVTKQENPHRVLHGNELARYLADPEFPEGEDAHALLEGLADPLWREHRLGIQLGSDKRVVNRALYQAEHWRLQERWAFAAECEGLPCPPQELPATIRFGGVARMADIERPVGPSWPAPPDTFPEGRLLLYVATPAVWTGGWLPPLPPEVTIIAAAIGPPETYSTAVPGGGGRFQNTSLRFRMTPAGSVYHLQFPSAAAALEWSQEHHARALGPAVEPRPNRPQLDTAGFGVVLTGVWK